MANYDHPNGFRPYMMFGHGGVQPTWHGLLKSNTLVSTGDALYATAGYVTPTATTDKYVVGVATFKNATSTTTNVSALFYPAVDWIYFEGQCSGTMTQAKVWTEVDIEGTRGIQEVNEDATSNKNVLLIGVDPRSSIGANTRVVFLWSKSKFTGKATSDGYGA